MAWTTPRTWVSGETVSAVLMNTHVRDNLNLLKTEIKDSGFLRAVVRLTSETGAWGCTNAVDTDLATYSVPAGTLETDGEFLLYLGWGSFAANGNGKYVSIYFGATGGQVIYAATVSTYSWFILGAVLRTGAASQVLVGASVISTTMAPNLVQVLTPAETLANAVVIKLKGQGSVTNDVVQKGYILMHGRV
jgi:hypothetical protein